VAILSRVEPQNIQRGIPGLEDSQARMLTADVNGVWIVSAYVPNGESEKYHTMRRS
jgi:exodeoxyribonuclease-3